MLKVKPFNSMAIESTRRNLAHSNYQIYKVLFSLLWLIVPTHIIKAKPSCSQHDNDLQSLKLRDSALGVNDDSKATRSPSTAPSQTAVPAANIWRSGVA